MTRTGLSTLSLLVLATACGTENPPALPFDEEAIREEVLTTLEGLTAAMNAHDPEAIFGFYRQDPSFLYLGCTDVLYGWETFSARVGPYYRFNEDVEFEQEVLSVQVLAQNVAVAAARGRSTEAEALFWSYVLRKVEDGRWLVTYEHESWPGCSVPSGPHMGTEGGEDPVPTSPRGE